LSSIESDRQPSGPLGEGGGEHARAAVIFSEAGSSINIVLLALPASRLTTVLLIKMIKKKKHKNEIHSFEIRDPRMTKHVSVLLRMVI
jgi:hypothetical protein